MWEESGRGGRDKLLPVVTISFCWDSREHPDPKAGRGGEEGNVVGASLHDVARFRARRAACIVVGGGIDRKAFLEVLRTWSHRGDLHAAFREPPTGSR